MVNDQLIMWGKRDDVLVTAFKLIIKSHLIIIILILEIQRLIKIKKLFKFNSSFDKLCQ
jgi:hypothetical protein